MNINEILKAKELTDEQMAFLYTQVVENDFVRKAYIQSRAFVIEPLIQKESQVRRIFTPEILAPGANPYYTLGSKEVQTAWISSGAVGAPRRQVEGDEVWVNTLSFHARAEWKMDLAMDARFNLIEETNFYVTEQLKEMENALGWNLIRAAAAHVSFPTANTVQIGSGSGLDFAIGQGYFSPQMFAELQYAADTQRRNITDIFVSPRTMFDIWSYWGLTRSAAGTSNPIEVVHSLPQGAAQRFFDAGTPNSGNTDSQYTMDLFGVRVHKVYDTNVVDDETVYAFDLSGKRGRFGVMPIRERLKTYEDPTAILDYKVGYFARQRQGYAILDPVSMFVGTIDRGS